MGLSLTTDIALDVSKAADPQRLAAARAKLLAIKSAGDIQTAEPAANATNSKGAKPPVVAGLQRETSPFRTSASQIAETPAKTSNERAKAAQEFEAFILQTFVQELLPKDAESVYGHGTAGSAWRSMLSEKIAHVIAESGGIGIAERLTQAIDDRFQSADATTALVKSGLSDAKAQSLPAAGIDMLRNPSSETASDLIRDEF